MNATEVLEALHRRWPDDQYVTIEEAPQDSARLGRRLDLLAISVWRSRGYKLDGVEVKVSYADWKKERDAPEKADWWWHHVHRFWIAAPADLAKRIRPELPEAWGLLGVGGTGAAREVVAAPHHAPEPLSFPTTIGLLRAARGVGLAALQRAEQRGITLGRERAEADTADRRLAERYETLTAQVAAAEAATGIPITGWPDRKQWGFYPLDEFHEALKVLLADRKVGAAARRDLERLHARAQEIAAVLDKVMADD